MDDKSLNLTVLGSGSAIPYEGRASSSYLISYQDRKILLDAGFYVLNRLDEAGVSIDELDAIFITHKHPDHFMGLIHILFALKNPIFQRKSPLKIYGFKGLKKYLLQFEEVLGRWIKPNCGVEIIEANTGKIGKMNYTFFSVLHSAESIGIKFDFINKSIFYTGDTKYFPELQTYCKGVDLLIADCGALVNESTQYNKLNQKSRKGALKHMNSYEIITLASKAAVKKVLMSHFYPGTNEYEFFAPDYNFQLLMARDLMKIFL